VDFHLDRAVAVQDVCRLYCTVLGEAIGNYLMFWPRPFFKIAICDLERCDSSPVSRNMKSAGNRFAFRLTASFPAGALPLCRATFA
jgi:hypothetical protein